VHEYLPSYHMIMKSRILSFLLVFLSFGFAFLVWRMQSAWVQNFVTLMMESVKPSIREEISFAYPNKTLLMVQYTGGSTYSELLNLTQPVNEAYAECWGYDYECFTGLMIQSELSDNETTTHVPESRATYNKVMILERVLTDPYYQKYDMLLILDSDALMYDFSRDIAAILPENRLMAAHKVSDSDEEDDATWNVNIGVTVWNLRHQAALPLCLAWKQACLHRIRHQSSLRDSDQTPLQTILRRIPKEDRQKIVSAVPKELGYRYGRWVRHFIRPDANNWTDFTTTMEYRLEGIRKTVDEICNRTVCLLNHENICRQP
jgi:hypothetical protein